MSVENINYVVQKTIQNFPETKIQTDHKQQISGQSNLDDTTNKDQEEVSEVEIIPDEVSKVNILNQENENDVKRNTKIKYYKTTLTISQEISQQATSEEMSIEEFFQDQPLESENPSYIHPRIQKSQSLLDQKKLIQKCIDEIQEKHNENSRKQGEDRDQQTTKIFSYVEEFSMGTFKYEENTSEKETFIQKKYIPIFPQFYLDKQKNIDTQNKEFNFNSCQNFGISDVECNFFNKNQKRLNQQSNFQSSEFDKFRMPTQLQIKFRIQNANLKRETQDFQDQINKMKDSCLRKGISFRETQLEQKHRQFQIDISLQVCKSNQNHQPRIYYDHEKGPNGEILEDGLFYFIIDLSNPCEVLELLPRGKATHFQKILSPFRHTNDLLNYWNLKQVIFIKGRKKQQFDPKPYLRKLIEQEYIQKQTPNVFLNKSYNFDLVRFEFNPHSKKALIPKQFSLLEEEIKFLQNHIISFKEKIESLAFPLRLSIMVLISNRKVQIFDENIISLINQLLSEKFTTERQQELMFEQIHQFWENRNDPENFKYKSYQIAIEALSKKTGWLEIERPLKHNQLFELVKKYLVTQDVISKKYLIKLECDEYIQDPNRLPQRRIWVTPTLKIIRPMEVDQSNPVLREIKYLIEYMTRINILNDYQSQEWFNNDRNEPLLKSFVEPVIREVSICGINFKYLNHSASQIKQKSWWQYTDNHGFRFEEKTQNSFAQSSDNTLNQKYNSLVSRFQNRDEFLKTIGEFTDKKELKKLAREGQSMSSSTYVLSVEENQYIMIPDEEFNKNNYTDGCGYISNNFMETIRNHPHFNLSNVSAIQMRCFGFKGVLVSHPGLTDKNTQIVFRNSMEKFKGEINQLSVIRCATYSPGFLNRQVILLLDYLGVPQELFIKRNQEVIQNLDIIQTLERLYKQARNIKKLKEKDKEQYYNAKELLEEIRLYFGPSRQFKNVFVRAILASQSFIKQNDNHERFQFSLSHEPIFEQILSNMVLGQSQLLKKKQRIRIKDSAVLIGVCDILNLANDKKFDEDQMLGENEIFCQIQVETTIMKEEKSRMRQIFKKNFRLNDENCGKLQREMMQPEIQLVEGEVLITKNPCGHKGDIRRVKAIGKDHPAYKKLSHLVNVIVFPAQGSRPLQNMMSGGDLDGDVYMIIWDQEFVQSVQREIPPAAQYDDENLQNNYTVELQGSKDFAASIADYFQRDLLGKMANIHLSLAISEGVDHPETEKAAYLCSIQVDFAKHGRCIKLEAFSELKRLVEKKGRPRFLVDDRDDPYESEMPINFNPENEHIIQKLFDMVDVNALHQNCLRIEHKYAVMLEYTISDFFINLNFNDSLDTEGIENILNFACYIPHFEEIFEKLVWPMEQKLKQIMMKFKIVNEGELFCSDFQYKFVDEKQSDFIGAVSRGNEDTKNEINRQLDLMISEHKKIFQNLAETLASRTFDEAQSQFGPDKYSWLLNDEPNQIPSRKFKNLPHYVEFVKQQLAKVVYFVSYFDIKNKHIEAGITKFKNSLEKKHKFQQANFREEKQKLLHQLNTFILRRVESQMSWVNDNCPRIDEDDEQLNEQMSLNLGYELILDEIHDEDRVAKLRKQQIISDELREELTNFDKYIKVCKRAAADNEDRVSYLWAFKKVFTTPWLICYDYLLV